MLVTMSDKELNRINVIQSNGDLFECKQWPYTGWCGSSSALHYEPGISLNWKDAWHSK